MHVQGKRGRESATAVLQLQLHYFICLFWNQLSISRGTASPVARIIGQTVHLNLKAVVDATETVKNTRGQTHNGLEKQMRFSHFGNHPQRVSIH